MSLSRLSEIKGVAFKPGRGALAYLLYCSAITRGRILSIGLNLRWMPRDEMLDLLFCDVDEDVALRRETLKGVNLRIYS